MDRQKTFIITGGSFSGKGATSMLYIVVDELIKRFPGCKIYADVHSTIPSNLSFTCVNILPWVWKSFLNPGFVVLVQIRRLLRRLLTDYPPSTSLSLSRRILFSADAIMDISGFALSSQFDNSTSVFYLDRIAVAKKLGIPIFLLPQSFGPFDYHTQKNKIIRRIKALLTYPEMVFAREEQGYHLLVDECGVKNVVLSTDIVLQNQGVDYSHIFKDYSLNDYSLNDISNITELKEERKVAIIPNYNMYRIGKKSQLILCYKNIIQKLIEKGFFVFLVTHNEIDAEICNDIRKEVDNKGVIWITDDMSVMEFETFIRQFDFTIGSRYHGVVHALKSGVPSIAIGWAAKYKELMAHFNQQKYALDIRDESDMETVLEVVQDMESNFQLNHRQIINRLPLLQKDSCFRLITDYFHEQLDI